MTILENWAAFYKKPFDKVVHIFSLMQLFLMNIKYSTAITLKYQTFALMKNNNSTLFNAWWTVHRKKPAHFVRRKSGLPALVSSKYLLVTSWPLRKQWPVWVQSRYVLTPVNPRSNCTREGCMTSNPAIQSCLTTLSWLLGTECIKARTTG